MDWCASDHIIQEVAVVVKFLMTISATLAMAYKISQVWKTPAEVTLGDVITFTLTGATVPLALLFIACAFDRRLLSIVDDLNVYLVVVGGVLLFQSLKELFGIGLSNPIAPRAGSSGSARCCCDKSCVHKRREQIGGRTAR